LGMKTKYQVLHGTVKVSVHASKVAAIKAAREYLGQQPADRFVPVSVARLNGCIVWSNR